MPIYEYQCPQCQQVFEEWLSVSEATDKAPCPQCHTQSSRIISNTAFVLKGGGWYVTEYGNRKNTNAGATSSGTAAPVNSGASEATGTPSTSPTAAKTETANSTATSSASA